MAWFIAILSFGFSQSRPLVSLSKHVDLISLNELTIDWENDEFVALEKRHLEQESDFMKWIEHSFKSYHYQQDGLKLIDPKGDAFLIRKLDTIPTKLLHILFNGSLPQAEIDEAQFAEFDLAMGTANIPFEIGETVPIDIDRLLVKCRDIMQRHYPDIEPFPGEEHDWSTDAKDYLIYGFWHRLGRYLFGKQQDFPAPLFQSSKLFLCLACGWTSRYCVTGKESALKERIMEYPDRSVYPHDLFEISYVLNDGNLYLTFLTCENVLAGNPHRKNRQNDPLQQKLAYIRHDSKETGDNYGAWYHFFGIALYGMLRTNLTSRSVAEIENLGSFLYEGPDKQETHFNRLGALFGIKFRNIILQETWKAPLLPSDRTDYLLPHNQSE